MKINSLFSLIAILTYAAVTNAEVINLDGKNLSSEQVYRIAYKLGSVDI